MNIPLQINALVTQIGQFLGIGGNREHTGITGVFFLIFPISDNTGEKILACNLHKCHRSDMWPIMKIHRTSVKF